MHGNVQGLQKEATDLLADGQKLRSELEDGFNKILKVCEERDLDDDDDDEDDEDEAGQANVQVWVSGSTWSGMQPIESRSLLSLPTLAKETETLPL